MGCIQYIRDGVLLMGQKQDREVREMDLLKSAKTVELVEELKKREGVRVEYAEPHTDKKIGVNGPAIILIVTD